jgi:hypothetical protein
LTSKDIKEIKLPEISTLYPPITESSRLLIGCQRSEFSASAIAHAVEDCDAHLLNLNVTSLSDEEAQVVIDLRVNHRNPARIAQSLERYGYTILALDEEALLDDETIRSRFDQLMFLLDL